MIKKAHFLLLVFAVCVLLTGCESKKTVETKLSLRQIAMNAESSGDYDTALLYYDKALKESSYKITPIERDVCMKKAELLYKMGDFDGAIDVTTSLIDFDNEYSDAYYLRGLIYLKLEHTETALTDFSLAIEKCDKDYETYIAVSSALDSFGYSDEASNYLMSALSFKGDSRSDLMFKGRISYIMGNFDNSKTFLEAAIDKKSPDEGDKAKLYLADTYTALGLEKEASDMYTEYANEAGDGPDVCLSMGNLLYKKGDYKNALSYYQKGKETTDKPYPGLLRGEIAALEKLGKFKEAKSLMRDYLKLYPDDETAARENLFLKTR